MLTPVSNLVTTEVLVTLPTMLARPFIGTRLLALSMMAASLEDAYTFQI